MQRIMLGQDLEGKSAGLVWTAKRMQGKRVRHLGNIETSLCSYAHALSLIEYNGKFISVADDYCAMLPFATAICTLK